MKTAEGILRNKYNLKGERGTLRIDQVVMFMKEYAEVAIEEDRKNVAEHATIELFAGGKAYKVDKDSIINAPKLELK